MDIDLVVIGAGVSGLAAAGTASRLGLEVVLIDERSTVGGSLTGLLGSSAKDPDASWLAPPLDPTPDERALVGELESQLGDTTLLLNALTWGAFPGFTLAVLRGASQTERVTAKQLILATGEYVVRPPLTGFELDGVVSPLGLVRALEQGLLLPSETVVVLGANPTAEKVLGFLGREGITNTLSLSETALESHYPNYRHNGSPKILGSTRVERVEFQAISSNEPMVFDVDWVVVTEPSTGAFELGNQLGGAHYFAGFNRGFRPLRGGAGATSIPGLFVAGSLIGDNDASERVNSGRIAGYAAALRCGVGDRDELDRLVADQNNWARTVPASVPSCFEELDFSSEGVGCRCTGATLAEIGEAVRQGARTLDDVKRRTRAGMGYCQGRDCQRTVIRALVELGSVDPATLQPLRGRPPVRPIKASAMLEAQ